MKAPGVLVTENHTGRWRVSGGWGSGAVEHSEDGSMGVEWGSERRVVHWE